MKNIKTLTLLTVLLLGLLLSSCGAPMTPSAVTPAAADSGITLKTQFPVYAPDVPFIQFTITNNSGAMAEFGTSWTLERLDDGTWYAVPFKPDTAWTMPLYMLSDGGTASDTAHLSILDHKFKAGTYRIVKEINDSFYTAEFSVGDSPVGKNSPYGYAPMESLSEPYTAEIAEKDGVVILDASTDLSRFFDDMAAGMNTQLRFAQKDGDSLRLFDLTVEYVLGSKRIRFTADRAVKYYSHIVSDGTQTALSNTPTWDADDTRLIIDAMCGNTSALDALAPDALQPQDSTAIDSYRRAAFWSEDGTRLLSLSAEPQSPLEFGISVQYADGGSAGHTVVLDTPGMKSVRGAMWTSDTTVMLICDTADSSLDNVTGYVFYDAEKDEVTGYTYSQYAPVTQSDGTVLIPE